MSDGEKPVRYRTADREGEALSGVPNRDLTQLEYDGLTEERRAAVDESGLYRKSEPKGRPEPEKKGE
jgi:hypothetical protein